MPKSIIFAILAILILAGCASTPPLPKIETKRGDRIGVFVEIGPHPGHTHIGTTVFHNFAKVYPYEWGLEARVQAALVEALADAGFEVVDLKSAGLSLSQLSGLVAQESQKWALAPNKADQVSKLRDGLALRGLFLLKQTEVAAALECGGGGCSVRTADMPGLYSRDFFGITNYSAVAAFKWNIYVFDPPADLAAAESMNEVLRVPAVPLVNFGGPANFNNISEKEFEPVRDMIVDLSRELARRAALLLNPS